MPPVGRFATPLRWIYERIMIGPQAFSEWLASSSVSGWRSSALQTVVYVFASLLGATILAASVVGLDAWLVKWLAGAAGVVLLLFIASFVFLLRQS